MQTEPMRELTPEDPGWAESFAEKSTPLRKRAEQLLEQASLEGTLDPRMEKAWKLSEDEEFLLHLLELEEPEQVQEAFAEKGVALTIDEVKFMGAVIEKMIENDGELTEEDLEEVAGGLGVIGTGLAVVAIGTGWAPVVGGIALASVAVAAAVVGVAYAIKKNARKIGDWFRRW